MRDEIGDVVGFSFSFARKTRDKKREGTHESTAKKDCKIREAREIPFDDKEDPLYAEREKICALSHRTSDKNSPREFVLFDKKKDRDPEK